MSFRFFRLLHPDIINIDRVRSIIFPDMPSHCQIMSSAETRAKLFVLFHSEKCLERTEFINKKI